MARLLAFRAFHSPVERELFHWWPGHDALFIELVGCNARCPWCTKEVIAHVSPRDLQGLLQPVECTHERVVLTGGEVAVNAEQVLEALDELHERRCEVAVKTCGLLEDEVLRDLCRRVSACVVYVFGSNDAYSKYLGVERGLELVTRTIARMLETGVHVEVAYMVIPKANASREAAAPVFERLRGLGVAVHIRRCVPRSEFRGSLPASNRELQRLFRLAKTSGLTYVYITDSWAGPWRNTYCPSCGELLIERLGLFVSRVRLRGNRCPVCGTEIPVHGEARVSVSPRLLDLPHYILRSR